MKRTAILVVSLALILTMSITTAYGESNEYYLADIDLTVTIPNEFTVFTRNIRPDDTALSKYGFTKDYLLSIMESQNTYIEVLSEDGLTEMYIAMFEDSGIADFSAQSDLSLTALMDEIMPQYSIMGINMTKSELYHHSQTKFIKLYGEHPVNGMTVYTRQYSTVYWGRTYNFTLQSFSGKINDDQEKALQSIVDSAVFGKQNMATGSNNTTSSFGYTDDKTGLRFTVPAGWKEAPISEKRETIDVKFALEGSFAEIFYGSLDMWNGVSEIDKTGLQRSDINNSFFTLDEIKDAFFNHFVEGYSIPADDVTTALYNGVEYFCLNVTVNKDGITIPMTQLLHIDNGYVYIFQFIGDRTSESYKDFESLLSSAVYKMPKVTVDATKKPASTPKSTSKSTIKPKSTQKPNTVSHTTSYPTNKRTSKYPSGLTIGAIAGIVLWALIPGFIAKSKGRSFLGYFLLGLVVTPLVTMIISLCLKNRNDKNKPSSAKDEIKRTDADGSSVVLTTENDTQGDTQSETGHDCDDKGKETEEEQKKEDENSELVNDLQKGSDVTGIIDEGYNYVSAFIKHYKMMLEIARKSPLSHNPEFELLPAMYVVSDYATASAGKDRNMVSSALLKVMDKTYPGFNQSKFDQRCILYGEIIRGKELRCEWYMGNSLIFNENAISKCTALLGDILYNPKCADDYDNAPIMLNDVFQAMEYTENVMNPLLNEFVELFKECYSL